MMLARTFLKIAVLLFGDSLQRLTCKASAVTLSYLFFVFYVNAGFVCVFSKMYCWYYYLSLFSVIYVIQGIALWSDLC